MPRREFAHISQTISGMRFPVDVCPVTMYRGGMAEYVRDPDIPDLLSLGEAAAELGYNSKQGLLNRVARREVACIMVGNSYAFRAALIAELKAAERPN